MKILTCNHLHIPSRLLQFFTLVQEKKKKRVYELDTLLVCNQAVDEITATLYPFTLSPESVNKIKKSKRLVSL